MNNCLFEVSEEDSFSLVFKYIAEILDGGQTVDAESNSAGGRFLASFYRLVEKDAEAEEVQVPEASIPQILTLFVEQLPLLVEKGSDADIESCIQIINHHLLTKLGPEDSSRFAVSLASAISANHETKTETRLACLLHLYNACARNDDQYNVLMKTIDFAISARVAEILAPIVKDHADALVENWKLSHAAASKLYLGIAVLVRQSKGDKETHMQSLALTSKALASVDASDSSACKEMAGEAAAAVADFLKSPKTFSCDLLELAPVKALSKNPTHLYLHQLFSAVARGQINQLETVCRPDLLQSLGITREDCLEKTRMSALLGLARATGNKPILYDQVASALQTEREEVEQWIVKATGAKLLSARIDQIQEVIVVTSCISKGFDGSDWKRLKEQLTSWHSMLKDIQQKIHEGMNADVTSSLLHV